MFQAFSLDSCFFLPEVSLIRPEASPHTTVHGNCLFSVTGHENCDNGHDSVIHTKVNELSWQLTIYHMCGLPTFTASFFSPIIYGILVSYYQSQPQILQMRKQQQQQNNCPAIQPNDGTSGLLSQCITLYSLQPTAH